MGSCECGYTSTVSANLRRHCKRCVARSFALRLRECESEVARLQRENQCMREALAAERARPLQQNIYDNSTTNATLQVIAFGNEPTPNWPDTRSILYPPEDSVRRYIEMKHFRSLETANVRITNKRTRTVQIVEQDTNRQLRWQERDRKALIEKLTSDNLDELVDEHGAERVERWKVWYRRHGLCHADYRDTAEFKRISQEVENMLLSQRQENLLK